MANSTIKSDFLRTVLQNGVGRYVPQLQRLTIKFCKTHGGSRGIREYIEKEIVTFAENNPSAVVYLKPRRFRVPRVVADYVNGNTESIAVNNMKCEEIIQWIEYLKLRSGQPIVRHRKHWHTDNPSIQGVWTPFTHKPTSLNVTQFPNSKLSNCHEFIPSATEYIKNYSTNDKDN